MPAATVTKPAPTHLSAKIFLLSVSCFKQIQKTQKLSKLEEVLRKKKEHNHKYKDKIKKATILLQNCKTKLPVLKTITINLQHRCQNTEKLTMPFTKGKEINEIKVNHLCHLKKNVQIKPNIYSLQCIP